MTVKIFGAKNLNRLVWMLLILLGSVLSVVPFSLNAYTLHVSVVIFYYVILACSWNLIAGFTGQFSLAHVALATIGAYTSALLATNLSLSPWLTMFVGAGMAAAISLLLGRLCLRLRAIYLSIATWAFAGAVALFIAVNYQWTSGNLGLITPRLITTRSDVPFYFVGLIFTIASVLVMYIIVKSRIGLYMKAIREDEEAASVLAVDTVKWKTFVFVVAGFFAGLAGAFEAHFIGVIAPTMASFEEMGIVIMSTMIGGFGTFLGPLIGAPVVEFMLEYLRAFGEIRLALFAAVVIVVVMFFREGIAGGIQWIHRKLTHLTSSRPQDIKQIDGS